MTPEEEVRRAGKAREILENEMFKESFAAIESAILMGLRQSALKDAEMREKLVARYDILHTLRDQLQSHMESGVLALEEIRQKSLIGQGEWNAVDQ